MSHPEIKTYTKGFRFLVDIPEADRFETTDIPSNLRVQVTRLEVDTFFVGDFRIRVMGEGYLVKKDGTVGKARRTMIMFDLADMPKGYLRLILAKLREESFKAHEQILAYVDPLLFSGEMEVPA